MNILQRSFLYCNQNVFMKVYIYGDSEEAQELFQKAGVVVEELGLTDFIKIEQTQDEVLQKELEIKAGSALIIEEESIDFKDMIFEGMIPSDEDMKSMFVSIIGWGSAGGWCAPGWCSSWDCSC